MAAKSQHNSTIWYVIIDSQELADSAIRAHNSNITGLESSIAQFDKALSVQVVTVDRFARNLLAPRTITCFEDILGQTPFAIFNAGSLTWWNERHRGWHNALAKYGDKVILSSKTPMFSVCGSHQLTAAVYCGMDYSIIKHMGAEPYDPGARVDATKAPPPNHYCENGLYGVQIVASAPGEDALVACAKTLRPLAFSCHHADEVDLSFFSRAPSWVHLMQNDPNFPALVEAGSRSTDFKVAECAVAAMMLNDPSRVFYSTQFHPEIDFAWLSDYWLAPDGTTVPAGTPMQWVAGTNEMIALDGSKIVDWDPASRTYTDSQGRTFAEPSVVKVPGDHGNGNQILQAFWQAANNHWQS